MSNLAGNPLSITGIQQGKLFPPDQYFEVAKCVNGSGVGCDINDGGGVAHSAAAGPSIPGPLNVTVFSVQFQVLGGGSTVLQLSYDTLVSGANSAQNLPHATENGLFSNIGLTAFFSILNAVLIAGHPVLFDASGSFNSKNTTAAYMSGLNYSWSFGDGGTSSGLTPSASHSYASTGNYLVRLTVTDEHGVASSYQRSLGVSTALGIIQLTLKDQAGNDVHENVTITLFNGSQIVETVTYTPSSNPIALSGIVEGSYVLGFSGAGVTEYSKVVEVTAGWVTNDEVGLNVQYPQPPSTLDLSVIQLILVVVVVGVGAALAVFGVIRKGRSERKRHEKR
jgi:hypothetical protein